MYKVLIVDDERMIREGMRRAIHWDKLKVSCVLTAASGTEALEIIRKERPEIMVTDISMPGMTGHELIERAQAIEPELSVIILTGYDKFEYARRALQLHVRDFLLKPIDEKVLAKSIRNAIEELEKERKLNDLLQSGERPDGISKQIALEKSFLKIIDGTEEEKKSSLKQICEAFRCEEDEPMTVMILLPVLKEAVIGKDETIISGRRILDICMDAVDRKGYGFSLLNENTARIAIVIFNSRCTASPIDLIHEVDAIFADESIPIPKSAIGNTVKGLENLSRSYKDAQYLLEHDSSSLEEVLQTSSEMNRSSLFRDVFETLLLEMCANVSNYSYVMRIYGTFEKTVDSYNLSADYTRECCFRMASGLCFSYLEAKGSKPDINLDGLLESMKGGGKKDCLDLTRQYLMRILDNEEAEVHEIILKAKMYIRQHLNEELSVASLAGQFYVSPNYFSRLFKHSTGEGCNEYIVKKRMEKAKSLVETTSFSASRIALMVGYTDANYFSITFKKTYGKSPMQYRNEGGSHDEK